VSKAISEIGWWEYSGKCREQSRQQQPTAERNIPVISVSEKAGRTEGRKDAKAGKTDRAVSDTT
jgi:hypothetical protein